MTRHAISNLDSGCEGAGLRALDLPPAIARGFMEPWTQGIRAAMAWVTAPATT
ncbi:hypothetical protein [Pseudoxanthomonas sp.]|uniref:hypothetical protein n=1 Tax=Pseudoxanthomonas sp. TaxID=1871049 RepID=UPI002FE3A966